MPSFCALLVALAASISGVISRGLSYLVGSQFRIHMKELCNASVFDIYAGTLHIGSYHDGLQGLNGYQNRLELIKESCTLILHGVALVPQNFTVAVGYLVNDVIQEYSETFIASVPEATSMLFPIVTRTMGDSAGQRAGCFVSLCVSLYPATSGLLSVLACLMFLCSSLNAFQRVLKPETGFRLKETINRGCYLNRFISLACQFVSVGLWLAYGCLGGLGQAFVILCATISFAVQLHYACPWLRMLIRSCCGGLGLHRPETRDDGGKCNPWRIACHLSCRVIPEIAFTVCAFCFSARHSFTDNEILALWISPILSMVPASLMLLYSWQRSTTETSSSSTKCPESSSPDMEMALIVKGGFGGIIIEPPAENDVENTTQRNRNTDAPDANVPSPNHVLLSLESGETSS